MPPDLADLIIHDHHVIERLFAALETDRADRFPLAHRLIDELAAHTAAEFQVLYPALRDIVPGGVAMANRAQADHEAMRGTLEILEQSHPEEPGFEDALRELATAVRAHVPVEENEWLPALRAVIGEDTMGDLGSVYAQVKDNLPSGLQALPRSAPKPKFVT